MTAAPVAAPRARTTAPAVPAVGGNEFAALLAGLATTDPACTAEPTCTVEPDRPVDGAPADQPLPEQAPCPATGTQAAPLVVPPPAPVAPAAPVVEAPATDTPHPTAEAARAGRTAAAPAAASAAAPAGPTSAEPASASAAVTGATAVVGQDLRRAAEPALGTPPTSASSSDALPVTADAPAVTQVQASSPGGPAATSSVAPVEPAPAAVEPGTTAAAPEAVQLDVPVDAAGDGPVPVLDVRSTVSPAAAAAGAQTAGAAVVEAVLPADPAAAPPPAAPAADPVEAPRPEVTPSAPTSPPAGAEAGVTGPQAADLRASAPAAPAAAAPPPPPATQVVQLLAPVLAGPDGSYSLSLQLYPEELGAVQVEVLLRGGEIRLAMHAPDEAAQAALRSALPDLRADLLAGGLSATSLSVDDGRPGSSGDRTADRSPDRRPDGQGDSSGRRPHPYRGADPGPRQPPSQSDAALDLRM